MVDITVIVQDFNVYILLMVKRIIIHIPVVRAMLNNYLSVSIPKPEAQNVLANGIRIFPPLESMLNTFSS
jgi:hypothetical protein